MHKLFLVHMITAQFIGSALWVLLFETLQNIPSMVGMIFGLSEKGWKKYLYVMGGMIVCAFFIAALENTKLLATTIAPGTAILLNIITYGVEMGVAACIYVFLTQWGNIYTDTIIGLVLAIGISVSSFTSDQYWSTRFFSHTLGFSATVIGLFFLFRKARGLKTLKEKIWYIVLATAIMSVLIAWIDYTPFLKS